MRAGCARWCFCARWLCAALLPLSSCFVPPLSSRPRAPAPGASESAPARWTRAPAGTASLAHGDACPGGGCECACASRACCCCCEREATRDGGRGARRPTHGRFPGAAGRLWRDVPAHGRCEVERLRRDVKRLEGLVAEVCGALVHSDDVALMERSAAALGPIYRDASFSASRRPVFARRAVECVLAARGLVATPPVRAWRTTVQTDEPDEPLF